MRKEKEKWGFRKTVSWILQCISYLAGIALAIKQFIPVEAVTTNKGLSRPSAIQPNFFTLGWVVVMVLIVHFGTRYWRNK